ncbi:hypothetical protein ACOMDM_09470 [Serratia plymuthica]
MTNLIIYENNCVTLTPEQAKALGILLMSQMRFWYYDSGCDVK